MRLTNICALFALVWLVAGTATGVWLQAELFVPGVRGDIAAKKALFDAAIPVHGALLQVSLPLAAGCATGLALLGERRRWLLSSVGASLVLAVSAIVPAVLVAVLAQASQFTLGVSFSSQPAIMILAGLVGLVAAISAEPKMRTPTILLGLAGLLPLALAGMMELVIANAGVDNVMHETYFLLAQDHAYGLALFFWSFAVLLAWAGTGEPAAHIWPAVLTQVIALVSGVMLVSAEIRLGLLGMPRHYIDYADGFLPLQRQASWAGFVLAFAIAAGAVFLAILKFRPKLQVFDAFN
ncbi:MAG: hypothetical protein R3C08_02285 [Hyphomonas sp.]